MVALTLAAMKNVRGRGSATWVLCVLFFGALTRTLAGLQHEVGDAAGWSLPSRAKVNYTTWSQKQTFVVGDALYFSYNKEYHNVIEVTAPMFASCNATAPLAQWSSGADVIPLNSSGTFYYICGIPGHCDAGQKVATTVEAAQTGTRHQVGGTPGWSLPSRSSVNYTEWASTQTFLVGDTLYFNYSKDFHNVMEVTKEHYDTCNSSKPILFWDDGATVVQLNTSGTFYFICGVPGHCDAGQKLAVRVATSLPGSVLTGTPSPSPAPSPISASVSLYANAMPAISNIMIILMVFTALVY